MHSYDRQHLTVVISSELGPVSEMFDVEKQLYLFLFVSLIHNFYFYLTDTPLILFVLFV